MTETKNETKVQVTSYSIAVKGVFGRNRKPKLHTENIVDVPEGQDVPADLQAKVDAILADIKAKPGCAWRVTATPTTIENTGTGFISRSFMMFSGVTVLSGVVA